MDILDIEVFYQSTEHDNVDISASLGIFKLLASYHVLYCFIFGLYV